MGRPTRTLLGPTRSDQIDVPATLGASVWLGLALIAVYLAGLVAGLVLAIPAVALIALIALCSAGEADVPSLPLGVLPDEDSERAGPGNEVRVIPPAERARRHPRRAGRRGGVAALRTASPPP